MNVPFSTRRLTLPNDQGWIEIRGQFNLLNLSRDQRLLIGKMSDWFSDFERTFSPTPQSANGQIPQAIEIAERSANKQK
jgi:hypothetical protein